MKALLVVDVQNDFCPGGALPAPHGDKVIPVINNLMDKFSLIYTSQDWHPPDTVHFKKWPAHCIKDTWGAKLHQNLRKDKISRFLLKGTSNKDNGYSAFEATNINFEEELKSKKVDEIYIAGLTTEYCVLNSAMDACKKGFRTFVISDAIEGVNQNKGDAEQALENMKQAGIQVINSAEL